MGRASKPDWRVEVSLEKVGGKPRYHWRAVDAAGVVLDFSATATRTEADEGAALRFLTQALKGR